MFTSTVRHVAQRRARGSVQRRGNAWLVRVSAGTDPVTGKRLWLCGTRESQKEAEKLRTKLLGQVDEKKASRTRASLGALLEEWLPGAELSATTRDNYAGLIDRFIRPALGALPLTRLTPPGIERFYGELRRCRARCDGRPFLEHRRPGEHDCAQAQCRPHECRPLAASSVLVLHAILSGALEAALRWEWVSVNPARAARRPKPPPPHPDPPTPEQAGRLITAAWAQDETWGTLVWLVMTTGMRRGEALALRWRHVHLDRQVLEIRRSYIQRRGRKIEKDTKTHQMRRIALDPDTTTVLAEHRDRARQRATLLGVATIDEWYLFSNDPAHSQPLHPDWVTHRYTAMAAEVGITTHLHALRHYSATELLAAGVDLATVSGRLGHGGGGATTLRVYAAWVAASDQRAAEVLGAKMPKRPRTVRST
ncbi:MAG: site-specific integrase [Pseudonocardiales bacterium]|nr:site-specific integrase [Pseudonocardiales bacterium]